MTLPSAERALRHRWAKPAVFAAGLVPFFYYAWAAFAAALGPNPAEALIRGTGDWTLRLLCITLAVTPLRRLTGLNALLRLRRMLGLFAFFYGVVHLLCYSAFDMTFDLHAIVRDIGKRPFVLAGTLGLLLMVPLAATSFNRAIRALGAARWQRLHRLVYVVAVAGLLHFWWMRAGKNDFGEPTAYLALVAVLMMERLWHLRRWHCSGARRAGGALMPQGAPSRTPGSQTSRLALPHSDA